MRIRIRVRRHCQLAANVPQMTWFCLANAKEMQGNGNNPPKTHGCGQTLPFERWSRGGVGEAAVTRAHQQRQRPELVHGAAELSDRHALQINSLNAVIRAKWWQFVPVSCAALIAPPTAQLCVAGAGRDPTSLHTSEAGHQNWAASPPQRRHITGCS